MIKKIVILGLIVCSLLVSPTISAVDTEGVIDDDLDDVLDENDEETSEAPNFDIDKLTYERDGQTVTVKLIVNENGIIEDKGSIEIFRLLFDLEYQEEFEDKFEDMDPDEIEEYYELLSQPYIAYWLILRTNQNEYNITYVNGDYLIKDIYATSLLDGDVMVDGNELSVTFDLLDSGDRLENLSGTTMELVGVEAVLFSDLAEGDCTDTPADTGSDSSSNTPGFEMIAVLVAIAIAFIILRRKKL